ncbi:hypothetical protein [Streptomyces sp. BK205]|uniref:alpha/beta fold hydrolase n=1 Tax=Streptomyces TaxID=1883 RepID=UPI00104CD114|nr:hypothetical protein [Streptomyces sp. BK205]TCR16877.1 hypothetical protein EV578_113208 [Streptomyces sp. BK205]
MAGIAGIAADTWDLLLTDLAAEQAVVSIDLPGSGCSPLLEVPLRGGVVADQMVTIAREAGLTEFLIAGTSLGAAVAVAVSACHPRSGRGLFTLYG